MTIQTIGKALLLASVFAAASSQASVAHLTLSGAPGEFVTGGLNIDTVFSSADPAFGYNIVDFANLGTNAAPATDYLSFLHQLSGPNSQFASLDFASPVGETLQTGVTYFNAQRAAFASPDHPGLDVTYGVRGCGSLSGDFTIGKMNFSGGQLNEFSVSFNQSCGGSSAALHGTFYYNASQDSVPTSPVPEPSVLAMMGAGAAVVAIARRRKKS